MGHGPARDRILLAVVALLMCFTGAARGAGIFETPFRSLRVDDGAYGVFAADMNEDGKPDLVSLSGSSFVHVFDGDGSGHFAPPRLYSGDGFGGHLITNGHSMAVGDIDGDGHVDVAASNWDGVSVMLGDGRGRLASPYTYDMGSRPNGLAIADFDGDGRQDLVATNVYRGTISVRAGRGKGVFGDLRSYDSGHLLYGGVTGDIDGDGRPDYVAAMFSGDSVVTFLNDGHGAFDAGGTLPVGRLTPTGSGGGWVALGDLNGDGTLDLVASRVTYAYSAIGETGFRMGAGDGTFGPETVIPGINGNLKIQDVDQDGHQDILIQSGSLRILFGRGDGTFDDPLSVGLNGYAYPGAADLDGDGRKDLFCTGGAGLSIVYANPDGAFPVARRWSVPRYAAGSAAGDLNGDGFVDVVTVSFNDTTVVTLKPGDGDFHFGESRVLNLPGEGGAPILADWHRRGHATIAIPFRDQGRALFLDSSPGGALHVIEDLELPPGLIQLLPADVNKDGIEDLLILSFSSEDQSELSILIGGAGDSWLPRTDYEMPARCFSMTTADFNRDGFPDVVAASERTLRFRPGQAGGTLGDPIDLNFQGLFARIGSGDFDRDGAPDLVLAHSDSLTFLRGDGHGHFSRVGTRSLGGYPGRLTIADLNGDALPDVAAQIDDDAFPVLLGQGDGTFADPVFYPLGGSLDFEDLDHDGRLDAIVTEFGGGVTLLRNGSQPPARTRVFVGHTEGWNVHLTWKADREDASFNVYRKRGAEPFERRNRVPISGAGSSFSFVDSSLTKSGVYIYRLTQVDPDLGELNVDALLYEFEPDVPRARVVSASPNPMRETTGLTYELPFDAPALHLDIFDLSGRRIRRLDLGTPNPGRNTVTWNGQDDFGRRCPAGAYFARINDQAPAVKVVLVR